MVDSHGKFRRILQWAFPGRLRALHEKWDGSEDLQTFLDRAAEWRGTPVSAADVLPREADYDARIAELAATPDPDEALADAIEAATTLAELKDALLGRLTPDQKGQVSSSRPT